jgi:hypothetical protein
LGYNQLLSWISLTAAHLRFAFIPQRRHGQSNAGGVSDHRASLLSKPAQSRAAPNRSADTCGCCLCRNRLLGVAGVAHWGGALCPGPRLRRDVYPGCWCMAGLAERQLKWPSPIRYSQDLLSNCPPLSSRGQFGLPRPCQSKYSQRQLVLGWLSTLASAPRTFVAPASPVGRTT